MLQNKNAEFSNERATRYKQAVKNVKNIWQDDLEVMFSYLSPNKGESILEIGAGSGFFSFPIAESIGKEGILYALDPSEEQLEPLIKSNLQNIIPIIASAEEFSLPNSIDKIWSRGAFHHVTDKTKSLNCWKNYSKNNTRLYIFDIFSHNNTSKFFDAFVASNCITGHEVSFLSKNFASSLCKITGWNPPEFIDIPLRWKFNDEKELGDFIHLLLGINDNTSIFEIISAVKEHLGIYYLNNKICVNWEMTLMITQVGK